jgi:hypothetical protein
MKTLEKIPKEDADFLTFKPTEYLEEYYSTVSGENGKLLEFFASASDMLPNDLRILEYGGGPTVYQLLSYAIKARSIVFGDYLQSNTDAVRDWDMSTPGSHDWSPFTIAAIAAETGVEPSAEHANKREALLKEKISSFVRVNAFDKSQDTLDESEVFDLVSTNFVAESISSTHEQWSLALGNITSRVAVGGWLSMTVIRNASYWVSGGKRYPGFPVGQDDVVGALTSLGFDVKLVDQIDADIIDPSDPAYEGYDGMVFVLAQRV